MTTTADLTLPAERERLRGAAMPLGIAAFVVSSIWTVLGAHSWQEYTSMVALALVTSVVVYGVAVPRALAKPAAPRTALAMSVTAALVLLPAFWSGLPLVLGCAGALLGYAGRGAAKGAGASVAALLLGLLSVVGYLTIYVVDGVILGNM